MIADRVICSETLYDVSPFQGILYFNKKVIPKYKGVLYEQAKDRTYK